MSETTNRICKNPNCTNGEDGKQKHFYACYHCEKLGSWKWLTCSQECYEEYLSIALADNSKPVETFVSDEISTKEEFDTEAIEPVEEDTIEE